MFFFFFFSSRRRHTRCSRDWSSDVCSSDLGRFALPAAYLVARSKRVPFLLWTGLWSRVDTPLHRRIFALTRFLYRHADARSEEHTSELQSRLHLVCRLLLEKKKKNMVNTATVI